MDKIQIVLYIVLIAVALCLLVVSIETKNVNKELSENIHMCQYYVDGNWEEIEKACNIPVIKNHLNIPYTSQFNFNWSVPAEQVA
jgi:hypothetical protein